jgi:uncharacterized membrane protein
MTKNDSTDRKKTSYTGLGIVFGASFGFIIALLFFDGNLGVGIAIGAAIGLVIGAILDAQRKDEQ